MGPHGNPTTFSRPIPSAGQPDATPGSTKSSSPPWSPAAGLVSDLLPGRGDTGAAKRLKANGSGAWEPIEQQRQKPSEWFPPTAATGHWPLAHGPWPMVLGPGSWVLGLGSHGSGAGHQTLLPLRREGQTGKPIPMVQLGEVLLPWPPPLCLPAAASYRKVRFPACGGSVPAAAVDPPLLTLLIGPGGFGEDGSSGAGGPRPERSRHWDTETVSMALGLAWPWSPSRQRGPLD
jgi:hypothetical protein